MMLFLGVGMMWCWWQIRALGDVRLHLPVFYGWFAVLFGIYLGVLWLVRRWELKTGSPGQYRLRLAIVLSVAVITRRLALPISPTLSDDIYRYQWDGRVQQAGSDPYRYPPTAPELAFLRDEAWTRINFPHLRTIYPPLTQQAFRLGTTISNRGQPPISKSVNPLRNRWLSPIFAQKLVFVGAEVLLIAALLWLLRHRGRSLLWVAAYAWHPLPILEIAGSGHNDALGVAFLWLGIVAWDMRRYATAAIGWALAFLSKYAALVLAPWWWFRRTGRRWLLLAAGLAVGPLLCYPTITSALSESLSAMTGRFESNSSIYVLTAMLLGHAALARLLMLLAGAVFLIWWARREADPVRYVLGIFTAAALLSPVLHPWYLIWIIPCFCFVRSPALIALTGTVVLAYTVWPGRLADGRWELPLWAHVAEYAPVVLLGIWELRRKGF